ncbi:MAG: carboxypeptidase regulatory-like domain-containing protein, partial [Burkholderiales bacterium]
MNRPTRPPQATVYAVLFVVSAACMAAIGVSASAYFVPAICLLLAAWLVWSGRGLKGFNAILMLNQLTAVVLILVLWLGDGLGQAKLNISGLALLGNLLTGGPLMGVLGLPLLVKLRFGKSLKDWFGVAQHEERASATSAGVLNAAQPLRMLAATVAVGAGLSAQPADAAALNGLVTADGKPVAGAMVTVFNEARTQRETVYTGADGRYAIRTGFAGTLDVRARLLGYADARDSVQMAAEQRAEHNLQLSPHASAADRTAALPASAHNARLPWSNESERAPFVSQCNYCHQIGNATTRVPRSHEAWLGTIRKMEGYMAMVTRSEANSIASVLARGFDGQPFDAKYENRVAPELARAKVEEWLVGDSMSFIHDMDVAKNGLFYGTDEGHDVLWALDPATGKTEQIALPDTDLPVGGRFAGMNLHIGIFTGKHGPHSMAEDKQGRLWITNALSSTIM